MQKINIHLPSIKTVAAAVALTVGANPVIGNAQGLALEEVVVTAQKRAQGLQDVPIAIAVMSGDKIDKLGMTQLEDVSAYLPGVHIGEAGTGTNLFIRGIGSGINFGFEQSVGMFITVVDVMRVLLS